MDKDSAARIELGRSFHQMGTVNEKVCESDFVPLWDGTIMRCSLRKDETIADSWEDESERSLCQKVTYGGVYVVSGIVLRLRVSRKWSEVCSGVTST